MSKKESVIHANSKWISRNLFVAVLISANDDIISVLCKHTTLRFVTTSGSENGCGK